MVPFFAIVFGIFSTIATIVVVAVITLLTISWIMNEVEKRINNNKNHKVVFIDTHRVMEDYLKENIQASKSYSLKDLAKMCDEKPYVMADVDKIDYELSDFGAFKSESVEDKVEMLLDENDGLLLIGE